MRSLPRYLFVSLALLLGSLQLAAAALPPETVECAGDCPEDEQQPGCLSHCTCSNHAPRVPAPAVSQLSVPASEGARRVVPDDELPPSPDPEPLLHVPKTERA